MLRQAYANECKHIGRQAKGGVQNQNRLSSSGIQTVFGKLGINRPPYKKSEPVPMGAGSDSFFHQRHYILSLCPPVLPCAEPGALYIRRNNPPWTILLLKRLPDRIRQHGSQAVILELSL